MSVSGRRKRTFHAQQVNLVGPRLQGVTVRVVQSARVGSLPWCSCSPWRDAPLSKTFRATAVRDSRRVTTSNKVTILLADRNLRFEVNFGEKKAVRFVTKQFHTHTHTHVTRACVMVFVRMRIFGFTCDCQRACAVPGTRMHARMCAEREARMPRRPVVKWPSPNEYTAGPCQFPFRYYLVPATTRFSGGLGLSVAI